MQCHVHSKAKDSPKRRRYPKTTKPKSSRTVKQATEEQILFQKADESVHIHLAETSTSPGADGKINAFGSFPGLY